MMKRTLLGAVTAVMILAGCGTSGNEPGNNLQTTSDNMTVQQEETTAETQTQPETKGEVKAEFSHDNIYMSVELPEGWEYEITEYDETKEGENCGIIFGPAGQKDLRYKLYYWPFYGICGTGVTIEELQLKNGTNIWRYSEKINDTLWRDIVFEYEKDEDDRGTYVLGCSADEKLLMEYEEELEEILETIVVSR